MNAYLLMRGMETLPMRMRDHCANAQAIAEFLERPPRSRAGGDDRRIT